ncbi:MAG TPA: hypothetical protein VMR54_17050 [Thermoanaerobaculia bacterium]|nr:hypothetical protein [Thermoanaerobaculia bacterium]
MEPVVGIFSSRYTAAHAGSALRSAGFPENRVQLLLPIEEASDGSPPPTEEAEQPGVGPALGGVLGAATGASAGFGLGAMTASVLLPGIGAVGAVGLWAAAVLGVAGAIGGASAAAAEAATRSGLPRDELYLYEDALARGKGVVFVLVDSDREALRASQLLEAAGAQGLDTDRKQWWIGIEDLERSGAHGLSATPRESPHLIYRRGFVAALQPGMKSSSYDAAASLLAKELGAVVREPAFRRGFEKGSATTRQRPEGPKTDEGRRRKEP